MATIYRTSGEWLEKDIDSELAMQRACELSTTLNGPVLLIDGENGWSVCDGEATELDEWTVDD